ncbi:RNA polymerase sigma factor [Gemmatimonas aurantiaca]|uniref:RNA polymerase sigma factor n=1 Tax=Gemmatimonas aurantiaca TaxID=173480 RepID=UPI00301CC25E
MTDADLARSALDGNAQAFTELAHRHMSACLRFATRMLGSREDAEEATQDTLIRAYRSLAAFDGRTAFRTWMFAILVNRCRTALLSRTRRARWVQTDPDVVDRTAVPSHGPDTELRVELERALETLPGEQREAFLLKHVEQLEYVEMARITGVGISALKMRVQRACTKLQQQLEDYDDTAR